MHAFRPVTDHVVFGQWCGRDEADRRADVRWNPNFISDGVDRISADLRYLEMELGSEINAKGSQGFAGACACLDRPNLQACL